MTRILGIRINAKCRNLLIERCVAKTAGKIHLIGHSLGGAIVRSIAGQRPGDIAFVITPGAPSRGTAAPPSMRSAAGSVRARILTNHGDGLLPACYAGHCTPDFVDSLQR